MVSRQGARLMCLPQLNDINDVQHELASMVMQPKRNPEPLGGSLQDCETTKKIRVLIWNAICHLQERRYPPRGFSESLDISLSPLHYIFDCPAFQGI